MRLKSITIEGFRAFGRQVTIDLDADVILLQGANGVGKTSLLDAILWALSGTISRFRQRGSPISMYAREGRARVELTLADEADEIVIVRATDGQDDFVRLRVGGEEFEQGGAEQRLCNLLLPHLSDRTGAKEALDRVLTRGVYLQQDLVREFIEVDTPSERFALVSEVIGAGAVLDLQTMLEKSRRAWAASTTAFRRDVLDPMVARQTQIDDHLARLSEGAQIESADAREAAEALFREAAALLGNRRFGPDDAPSTPARLDRFLKTLDAERSRLERELITVRTLTEQLPELQPSVSSDHREPPLRQAEAGLTAEVAMADESIEAETGRLAREREAQVVVADSAQRAATLARLALQDLGDHCPVCEQRHDVAHTVAHLEALIQAASSTAPAVVEDRLGPMISARRNLQDRLERIRTELRQVESAKREREARRSVVVARLADLGIETPDEAAERLGERAGAAELALAELSALTARGERLSLQVLRLGEQRQRDDLSAERTQLVEKLQAAKARAAAEEDTHALAGRIIEGLRGASMAVTEKQIEQIAPLFQRIYSRIDPHPTFRVTQIVAGMERGKGKLDVSIADPDASAAGDAGPLLSSSQLNSLAVSLFLAMNLALPSLKLGVTVLDDPLQSLDSINLLGLVDILRRYRAHRQIIVSTHEERLVGLLQRKLRPVHGGEQMITIVFDSWSREGPTMRSHKVGLTQDDNVIAA